MSDDAETIPLGPEPAADAPAVDAPAADASVPEGLIAPAEPASEDARPAGMAAFADTVRADPALFEHAPVEPPFARHVLTSPLHMNVAMESRTNLWTHWNGYTAADILTNIEDEYRALRHAAAISDISPLVKYRISGREALAYLTRLVADNPAGLSVDDAAPVVFCEDRGFVVGDGLLFRLGEEEYRLVTEETHLGWLLDSAIGFAVQVDDVSSTLAGLSLQGPLSARILALAGFADIETLRPYAARWFQVAAMPVYVSRTGSSGDLGYELWVDPEDAQPVWAHLLTHGAPLGLAAGGFALRELARIEAGIARAGRDYLGAFSAVDDDSASTPYELGLAALVDLDHGHFTGRDALRAAKAAPPRHILATLAIDWREPLNFTGIHAGGLVAGIATSTAFSPSLETNLALAMLKPSALAKGAMLHIEAEVRRGFELRRLKVPARIVAGPVLSLPARHLVPAPAGPKP
ncbi:MAG TPA: aminomethyltransferase family protein [Parvibaculum sp.]